MSQHESGPIRVRVLRYQCPHCRRSRAHLGAAYRHIARCFKNPAAKACKTCEAFQPYESPEYNERGLAYPGCPQSCGNGVDLHEGIKVHCEQWEGATA